jgi:hypothetical protein
LEPAQYPGSSNGYPCDIYENPSEHYAALGPQQGLLFPRGQDEGEQEEGEGEEAGWGPPTDGGGGWGGQSHPFFGHGEQIFRVFNTDIGTVFISKLHIFLAEARALQCKEITIYVFPEKELRGLSSNFLIHVSVSDLYIPTIGQLFPCSRIGRPIVGILYKNRTQKHERRNWD